MANDKIVLDLSNYKDRVGTRIAEGTYRVVVEDAEMDKSKAGNQMINVWFRVQGGDFDGATVTDRLVLTEKSLFRVVGFMQAIGLPTPKKRLQLSLSQFMNKTLDITVEDGEPYNGRVKSEVRGYARVAKAEKASGADLEDLEAPDAAEDVSDEPTDYDEDVEPAKAQAAAKKREAAESAPEPEDDDAQGEVDLDDLTDL